jgi:glutaminyl-tRNA synthetase
MRRFIFLALVFLDSTALITGLTACSSAPAPDGRKVKSTIQWVSAQHAVQAEVRLYQQLFTAENPDSGEDVNAVINPHSLEVLTDCCLEPSLAEARPGEKFQFERTGYFCVDLDSAPGKPVFNRTVTLKDTWAKIEKKQG